MCSYVFVNPDPGVEFALAAPLTAIPANAPASMLFVREKLGGSPSYLQTQVSRALTCHNPSEAPILVLFHLEGVVRFHIAG